MSLRLVYYTKSKQKKQALFFFEKKNEKIQKIHEIERTTVKEICKCGRAFPCRIHGFVVY